MLIALGVALSADIPSAQPDEVETQVQTKILPKLLTESSESDMIESSGNEVKPVASNTKKSEWVEYEATAYIAMCDSGCTGVTATGYNVKNRTKIGGRTVIAVDPKYIPLGTSLTIRLADGTIIEGRANDVGGAIKGRKIDVLMSSHKKAMDFGRQTVEVKINE